MLPALFPAITMIAHALEDYIETAGKVGPDHLPAIQAYTDAIRVIADHGENPGDSETTEILRALPHSGTVTVNATPTDQITRDIGFLLVLPKGLQRQIIGPGMVNKDMSGVEMAHAFKAIDALSNAKFLLMTSSGETDPEALGLPAGARVARKGCKFQMDMTNNLIEWGVFGNIKD